MEQTIWIVIAVTIAILDFIVAITIISMVREGGIRSLGDLFNLSKYFEILAEWLNL